jgi:hypothetical protein
MGTNRAGVSLRSPEEGNRSSFITDVFSSVYNSERCTKPRDPVSLSGIHHRQNPSDTTFVAVEDNPIVSDVAHIGRSLQVTGNSSSTSLEGTVAYGLRHKPGGRESETP